MTPPSLAPEATTAHRSPPENTSPAAPARGPVALAGCVLWRRAGRDLEVVTRRDYKSDFCRLAVAAPVGSRQVWLDGFRMGRVADRGQRIDVLYEAQPDHFNNEWRVRRRVIALREAQ